LAASAARNDRALTGREEAANAISHGIGFLLAVTALPILVCPDLER